MEALLEMRHVTKQFPGVKALDDVSIKVYRGEVLAICGENGAGKSTLMNVLSGRYPSREYEGEIYIQGQQVEFASVASAKAHGIEMVYQEQNIMLDATIAENLFVGNLPGRRGFVNAGELHRKTREALELVGLDLPPGETARHLNAGQLQMLSILRALNRNPKILVLDEPTSALTDQETDLLMRLMDRLRKQGVSCIFISHKLGEIYRIADRVVVMRDGKFVSSHPVGQVEQDQLIREMVGRQLGDMYPARSPRPGREVLRVEHLSVPHPVMPGRMIVDDISFSLRKGEILGIGGLVGAGRSEALMGIFGGLVRGVRKEVHINGRPVTIRSPRDAIRAGIGFVTEERKLSGFIAGFSLCHNFTLAELGKLPGRFLIKRQVEREHAQRMLEKMRVKAPSIDTAIVNLSGGNQQKVILGKWLLAGPDILFIDEPTKGIDVGARSEFYRIMNELTESGVSIVMVSSDMPELVSMSDRCIVLSEGRVTARLEGGEITQDAVLKAALQV